MMTLRDAAGRVLSDGSECYHLSAYHTEPKPWRLFLIRSGSDEATGLFAFGRPGESGDKQLSRVRLEQVWPTARQAIFASARWHQERAAKLWELFHAAPAEPSQPVFDTPVVGKGLMLWSGRAGEDQSRFTATLRALGVGSGYSPVVTSHMVKKATWERLTHLIGPPPNYLVPAPVEGEAAQDEREKVEEAREYEFLPAKWPAHLVLFETEPHSYREVPLRYLETDEVYERGQPTRLGLYLTVFTLDPGGETARTARLFRAVEGLDPAFRLHTCKTHLGTVPGLEVRGADNAGVPVHVLCGLATFEWAG
jgi:hypothetical protein